MKPLLATLLLGAWMIAPAPLVAQDGADDSLYPLSLGTEYRYELLVNGEVIGELRMAVDDETMTVDDYECAVVRSFVDDNLTQIEYYYVDTENGFVYAVRRGASPSDAQDLEPIQPAFPISDEHDTWQWQGRTGGQQAVGTWTLHEPEQLPQRVAGHETAYRLEAVLEVGGTEIVTNRYLVPGVGLVFEQASVGDTTIVGRLVEGPSEAQ